MKERPILFSAEMVRAILDGRKTQTRRVIKPQIKYCGALGCMDNWVWRNHHTNLEPLTRLMEQESPHGQPGDLLWVKETFYYDILPYANGGSLRIKPKEFEADSLYYRADGECCTQIPECQCSSNGRTKWRPSIFMPRWASRTTLEIKSIRVERLEDISDSDCLAEGISTSKDKGLSGNGYRNYLLPFDHFASYAYCEPGNSYRSLWESIHGPGSWEQNPWVWVIEFKAHPTPPKS